jgi:hypothetical protein
VLGRLLEFVVGGEWDGWLDGYGGLEMRFEGIPVDFSPVTA